MLQVSDAYKELVKSNIRPKCEPIIKVSGVDNEGNEIELMWQAKNIKDLKYKRAIDPVGRELPYMELTWTEIYTGKLNAENYPEKYNNIIKYMKVELVFVQDLDFRNYWKTVYDGKIKWKELFLKNWKQVKKETSQEVIKMPLLFLNAKPTIKGKTITWVAKDPLSLLGEEEMNFVFDGKTYSNTQSKPYQNPIIYILTNLRASFLNSKELFDLLTKTIKRLHPIYFGDFEDVILFEGKAKNSLLQYLNLRNVHIEFGYDYFFLQPFSPIYSIADFRSKVMYKNPEIVKASNISNYTFEYNVYEYQYDDMYEVSALKTKINNSATKYDYIFKDLGAVYSENLGTLYLTDASKYTIIESPNYNQTEKVVPISKKSIRSSLKNPVIGESYSESNPMNIYNEYSEYTKERLDFLKKYFNEKSDSLSFECLPNLFVETGDVVSVETNLYNDDTKLFKDAMVVEMELNYNGSLKEKIKCHEVNI